MSSAKSRGMKVGAVSLWLLLLLSERPMYGYEIKRELEKKFAGYWKPKTGTIYPALDKLEQTGLVTSQMEFRDGASDRKHYALTQKGQKELELSMAYWTRMTEVLENYWEAHQAIFRHKSEISKSDLARLLKSLGEAFKDAEAVELDKLFPSAKKVAMKQPREPIELKFLYAKEKPDKQEIHMEIEWESSSAKPETKQETAKSKK
jgi:DNA-binding PadR family transcriptional regulator